MNLINTISVGSSPDVLRELADNYIDLTVTSPPYDDLRNYDNKPVFDFKSTAKELYRITKPGGVLVWVVADQTIKGSESLSSFKQAIHFKEVCGFNLHDTMIYAKNNPTPMTHNRYEQQFEYMFVLSKGKPKTFNPLLIPLTTTRKPQKDVHHQKNYNRGAGIRGHKKEKIAFNIWFYQIGKHLGSKDEEAWMHPASFPEKLAEDHILSWSNPGDVVLDPFVGSGTTCKMAKKHGRMYIGFDNSPEYVQIANNRLNKLDTIA
jgi:DNA modification methylase